MNKHINTIKNYLFGSGLVFSFAAGTTNESLAQCVVNSANGYSVTLSVTPVEVVPSSTNCPYGYNFNYRVRYDIIFSGSNIPASLYTLQGTVNAPGFSGNFFDLPNEGGNGTVLSGGNSYTNKTNCNSVTVASLDPSISIQIEGPGISYRVISCPVSPLPVEMTSFTSHRTEEGIMLNWTTLTEKNNDYFAVERSADADRWETLDIVKGNGTSSYPVEYVYADVRPENGINYYRLKQTDFDGSYRYSKIIFSDVTLQTVETSIYPNPSDGTSVTLRVATSSQESMEAAVFDLMGKKLRSYTISSSGGWENYPIELPESGNMYLVCVFQNNKMIGKHQVLVK